MAEAHASAIKVRAATTAADGAALNERAISRGCWDRAKSSSAPYDGAYARLQGACRFVGCERSHFSAGARSMALFRVTRVDTW